MTDKRYKDYSFTEVLNNKGTNGYNVISTFSGGGGSSLGLALAGYNILAASEFIPAAVETYKANFKDTPVLTNDIRQTTAEDFITITGVEKGKLDVFEGSPPCSAFSMAGKREEGWGEAKDYSDDKKQVVDDLFFEWVRIAKDLQPKVLIAENVAGLVQGTAIGYFKLIMEAIEEIGYKAEARVLDASWLGVAQMRKRLIIIAVRKDLYDAGVPIIFPKPYKYQTLLKDAVKLPESPKSQGPILDEETKEDVSLYPRYATGQWWKRTKQGQSSDKYFQLIRCHPDKPVNTLVATAGTIAAAGITHPTEPRKFFIKELRALCSFPSDYILTGTYSQRVERMGRAVMPFMYKEVGNGIKEMLDIAKQKGF